MAQDNKPTLTAEPRPDWLIANIQGTIPATLGEMHQQGVSSAMFDMGTVDDYWSIPKIREAFKDPQTGQERKDTFDKYYKDQLDRYNSYRSGEFAVLNYNDSPNVTAKRVGAKTPQSLVYKSTPDPMGRSYSSITGFSKPEHSIREAAIARGVKMEDGSFADAKTYKGLARFSKNDNGEFNYDKDGSPYLEPLAIDKGIRQSDEVYNPFSQSLGYYGHDWDWTMLGSSLIKNPINFFVSAVDALAEYPKSLIGSFGGENSDAYKGIVATENWAKQFKIGTTDEGASSFFSIENITDLGQQVAYQLLSMGAVGKGVGSMTGSPVAASAASRMYMVGLAAGPMADVARDAGLSQREQALMLGMTTAAFYPLMSLSEAALGRLATNESQAAIKDMLKPLGVAARNGDKAELGAALLNLRSTISNFAYTVEKNTPKNAWGAAMKGAVNESIEETAEQVVDLGLRSFYNGYNSVAVGSDIGQTLGTTASGRFEIDPVRELEALGQSAIGGAIGGSIASRIYSKWHNEDNQVAKQMHDMVLDGKEQVLYTYLDKMHKSGRLDHSWETSKGELVRPGAQSKNDEAYNITKGVVDYLVQLRDNNGLNELYKNNDAKAASFKELLKTSSVGKDAADLHSDIIALQDRLEREKASKTPSNEQIAQTEAELQSKIESLNKIKNGEFVTDYVMEGIYNLASVSGAKPDMNMEVLSGKGFTTLTNSLSTSQQEQVAEVQQFNSQIQNDDATATLENFANISDQGKERLIQEAITKLNTSAQDIVEVMPEIQEVAENMGFEISVDALTNADPSTRNAEIDFLRNTILPVIENNATKDRIENFLKTADKLREVETYQPFSPRPEPKPVDLLLNMTQTVGKSVLPLSSSISSKIEDEFKLRRFQNEGGVSLYSNTPQLKEILDSINKRIAQIEGLKLMGPNVDNFLMSRGKEKLPQFTAGELATVQNTLRNQQAVVFGLLFESEENARNAENKIREATNTKFKDIANVLNYISQISSGSDYRLFEVIQKDRERLFKAIDAADFTTANQVLMRMENQLYENYSAKKHDILKKLFEGKTLDIFELEKPENSYIIESYNYLRGILSLPSSDFWNAYNNAYADSTERPSTSWEQDIIIKRAVQSLSADNYNPSVIAPHPNRVNHHSSVFVQGKGGTGKSSYVIPAIAATFQKLYGGKVLLAAYKDSRDVKRTKLVQDVKDFFPTLETLSVSRTLSEIIDDAALLSKVNLIVYDEATLIKSEELAYVNRKLAEINNRRKDAGMSTLKLLLTGDTLQNNIDVDMAHPEVRPFGIDHAQRHVIDRTSPLKFSFRQGNQQLILFTNYLERVQVEAGRSDGFQTEFKGRAGVRVIGNQDEFISASAKFLETLKAKNELHKAVYITDKSQFDIDPKISATGVAIMPSTEAQGEEWDYVIFDPKLKSLFSDGRNLAVKKDFYTASTRARKFLMISLPENSGITSREGSVNDIIPLNVERFNKSGKMDEINAILGDAAKTIKKRDTRKDVHVVPEVSLFSPTQGTRKPEATPAEQAQTTAQEAPASSSSAGVTANAAPAQQTQETQPTAPAVAPPPTQPVMTETGVVTVGDKVAEYIRTNVKGDFIGLHTFFTSTQGNVLPDVLDKKRKALYDRKVMAKAPYFITIAKIGTPEYANVIRANPQYNGTHAMFLEAEVDGTRVILGAFQSSDFDQFIIENNVMAGNAKISLPTNASILAEAQAWRPWVKNGAEAKLDNIRKKSTGIHFGSVRIHRFASASKNALDAPKHRAGEPFIPVSFRYTPQEIDKILNKNGTDEHITFVQLRSTALPFKTVSQILERYAKQGENGKWKFDFSEEGGRMYDAFWGNLANSNMNDASRGVSLLGQAFQDIYDTLTEGPYKNFIGKYASNYDPEVANIAKELKNFTSSKPTTFAKAQANYFMSNYIIAKNEGSKELSLFEKAISDLSSHPSFKEGFDFDPRIAYNTTVASVPDHVQAQSLRPEVYDNMLKAAVDYVSTPSLQIPKAQIANALSIAATPEMVPAVAGSGTSETSNESPSDPDNDTKHVDPFDLLDNMTLLNFWKKWFNKPGYITFMPDTITTFKRMVYDSIFSLNAETGPRLRDINDVMKDFRKDYKTFKEKYSSTFLESLDPVNDEKARELYKMGVIYNEIPFLLAKYFPAIKRIKVPNPETGQEAFNYVYVSNHHKQTHFNEKESFNLLSDGMTEMVKTQLYNTPLIQRTKIGYTKTGDYINPSHIESLVKMVKGATTSEEVAEKLFDSGSDVGFSVYNRFYNQNSFKVDGYETRSLGAIDHPEVKKMVDSISLFMLSGQVFDLASVNTDEMTFSLPNRVFGTPNILKETLHQAINSTAQEVGDQIYDFLDGSYVINQVKVESSKTKTPTVDDIIKTVNAMGIYNFTPEVLDQMYIYDGPKLGVAPNQDTATMESQIRSQLMDVVLIPTIAEMKTKQVRFTSRIGVLYDAITRSAGVKSTLSQRNIDGEIVYRLRYTAPLFRLGDRIQEIRDTYGSILSDNLLVKGDYEIMDTYVWEGVKNNNNPKSHNKMSADETIELDLLWGFANTLNEDHRKGKKYDTASFPGMVYSDSSTDIKFVVRAKDGYFRSTDAIAQDLFNANAAYTRKLSSGVTSWWNSFFAATGAPVSFSSLAELDAFLAANPVDATVVASAPGVVRNLYFVENKGVARIKPSLLRDISMFSNEGGIDQYKAKLEANYKKLLERAKTLKNSYGQTLYSRLDKLVEDKSPDTLLKAFYYNWVAFSQQLNLLTNGSDYQFDDKGKGESQEYIDLVKRAKLQISNRSHQLFRNKSWMALWQEAKKAGLDDTQLTALKYEGKKLPRVGKIAYVKDPVKALVNLVGETKMQEVYDGATFVSPLTRLMQYYSNAGEHGINTSPIMKNVTTQFNNSTGVNTNIKNAEFLLTPEIIRQGTEIPARLVQRMLSVPFTAPVNGTNNAYELIQTLGVSPDLGNVEWSHFEQLLDILVENQQQDNVILEVAPITSVKTGVGAVNEFDDVQNGIVMPYTWNEIDLISKGTQLDASHTIEDIPKIKTPTQHINALPVNWIDPVAIQRVLGGLVKISELVNEEFAGKEDFALTEKMKAFVAKAVGTKENISYLTEITDPSNGNQYSLDDRQVVNTFIRNFNAFLSDNAITPEFEGGHFILHPSSGLVQVYEMNGRVGLKSTFTEDISNVVPRDLKWASPTKADGTSFHSLIEQTYLRITGQPTLDLAMSAVKANPELKSAVTANIAALQATLGDGTWKPGYAEILLPAEMFKDFYIEDFNIQPDMVTPQYFAQILRKRFPKIDREKLVKKSIEMHKSFQKRLFDVVARIPGTGKHSGVVSKVVGFMNESQNAIFVPAELIFVQGADQDIDKGALMTFEAVEGITPEVDESYNLINGELFSDKRRKEAQVAGIKNEIVKNFMKITADPKSAVESNISVDSAMEEWKQLASRFENTASYSRYDFTSYADMKEINQSGKNMVGVFANANKAYQVLYTAFKAAGLTSSTLAGFNEDFNTTWIKLAALINLATDNAKLQVLGRLGIGEHNGNMVSYLIMKGATPEQIVSFLQTYKAEMEQLKNARRYDVDEDNFFSPAMAWQDKPDLATTYYKGEELSVFARSIMNRGIPSGPDEMYSYIYNMNKAINKTYKRVGMNADFDLMRFIGNEAIRNEQIRKYDQVRQKTDDKGIRYSEFNILQGIANAPHIMAYLKTFQTSHDVVNRVSRLYRITNAVVDNSETEFIKPDNYRDIQDFTYGLFVDDYLKANKVTFGQHDLSSLPGRAAFIGEMNSKTFIDDMKMRYPGNSFVESLSLEDHKRWGFATQKRLRTYDLMQMLEEKLLRLRVDFESLTPADRERLVLYHLIVDKGKVGKGSFGQLLSPADTKSFTQHLSSIDPAKYDYPRLAQIYQSYKTAGENTSTPHNVIPYDSEKFFTNVNVALNNSELTPVPQQVVDIWNTYAEPQNKWLPGVALEDKASTLEASLAGNRLSSADAATIRRVLNNYYKFVNDRSDKETLQRIIDCA